MGFINENHRLTDVGYYLLQLSENEESFLKKNQLNISEDSQIHLEQLLKLSVDVSGSTVRPFIVILYLLSELEYLTYDEFRYLMPLCTSLSITAYILDCIKKYRENRLTIDDIIIKDYKNILPGKSMEFLEKFKGPFGKIINPIIAKVLTVKPKVKKKECIGCKKCANICPVNAIEMIKKKPVINRDKCIRCFCCQEFCPVGAMKAHKNIIVKILTK
jgi:ferredoxin